MSRLGEDESLNETLEEESTKSNIQKQKKEDVIQSGESKFKYYSFDPSANTRSPQEIQKCIDFWKYVDSRGDILSKQGCKMSNKKCQKKHSKQEEELTWSDILDLLKSKQLDKLANCTVKKPTCNVDVSCASAKKGRAGVLKSNSSDSLEDDFELSNLDEFEPQKKFFSDTTVQTDYIEMKDEATQTDESASNVYLRNAMKGFENVLKEMADADLTGYFDCICEEPCPWFPYATVDKKESTDSEKYSKIQYEDKCICSCGEKHCLCSTCDDILTIIQDAKDSFEQLSSFEIETCPCSQLSCECLNDYRTLLHVKLEMNKYVREIVNDPDAHLVLPVRCACSCQQLHCPCKIVMKLFSEIDEIMGHTETKVLYKDKELDIEFGADVCRCDSGEKEIPCACLSFYRQNIEEKLQSAIRKNSVGNGQLTNEISSSNILWTETVCPNTSGLDECPDECSEDPLCRQNAVNTLKRNKQAQNAQNMLPSASNEASKPKSKISSNWRETAKRFSLGSSSSTTSKSSKQSDEEISCLCKDKECAKEAISSNRLSILEVKEKSSSTLSFPVVPTNSAAEIDRFDL